MAALIGAAVVACGSTATPSPRLLGQDPVGRPGGGSGHDFIDSLEPGTTFVWAVLIGNTAEQPAVVDGYELLDKSAALEVVGAAAIPSTAAGLSTGIGTMMFVDDDLRSFVAARPLVGSLIGGPNTDGWMDGGNLVFLLQAPSAGDYSLSAVRLRYHVGSQTFETDIPASLEVCVGATVPPGSACPFPSSGPSR